MARKHLINNRIATDWLDILSYGMQFVVGQMTDLPIQVGD
jgi:hypothetical protein